MFLAIRQVGKILMQNYAMVGPFYAPLLIGPFSAMKGHVFLHIAIRQAGHLHCTAQQHKLHSCALHNWLIFKYKNALLKILA